MKKFPFVICLFIFSICYISIYLYNLKKLNDIPSISKNIPCVSYEPSNTNLISINSLYTQDRENIEKDLKYIKKYTNCIRVYTVKGSFGQIFDVADDLGLDVILGIWIDKDKKENDLEIQKAIKILKEGHVSIKKIIVGNEVYIFKRQDLSQLIKYIKQIKKITSLPVGYSDIDPSWLSGELRDLMQYIDFAGVHLFPYYGSTDYKKAEVVYTETLTKLEKEIVHRYQKDVFIMETNWPSNGVIRNTAKPGLLEQREWLLKIENIHKLQTGSLKFYNVIGSHDQLWKLFEGEGRTGLHWGLFSKDGGDKVYLEKKTIIICLLISFLFLILYFIIGCLYILKNNKKIHYLYYVVVFFISLAIYQIIYLYSIDYLYTSIVMTILFILSLIVFFITSCVCLFYLFGYITKHKLFNIPIYEGILPYGSKKDVLVSVHIPICNEDPEHVIRAIQSCLNQDHKTIEIIIIDNNTENESLWKPVELYCKHNPNVNFIHINKLAGYKAGALNLALSHTNKNAKYIAVLDADYVANPSWITESLRYFTADKVAAVQSPQVYKNISNTNTELFAQSYQELTFVLGLMPRTHHNATMLHGTMCVLDADLLKKLGWAEWSIADDSELGLRLSSMGKDIRYIHTELGYGISPQNAYEFFRQQRRWVCGGVGILLHHWKKLFLGMDTKMNLIQRFQYTHIWFIWFIYLLFIPFSVFILINTHIVIHVLRLSGNPFITYMSIVTTLCTLLLLFTYDYKKNFSCKLFINHLLFTSALVYHISHSAIKALLPTHKIFTKTSKQNTKNISSINIGKYKIQKDLFFYGLISIIFLYYIINIIINYNLNSEIVLLLTCLVFTGFPYFANFILYFREIDN